MHTSTPGTMTMPDCPHCGSSDVEHEKSVSGYENRAVRVTVDAYHCQDCGRGFAD
jgi:transposase-like protein